MKGAVVVLTLCYEPYDRLPLPSQLGRGRDPANIPHAGTSEPRGLVPGRPGLQPSGPDSQGLSPASARPPWRCGPGLPGTHTPGPQHGPRGNACSEADHSSNRPGLPFTHWAPAGSQRPTALERPPPPSGRHRQLAEAFTEAERPASSRLGPQPLQPFLLARLISTVPSKARSLGSVQSGQASWRRRKRLRSDGSCFLLPAVPRLDLSEQLAPLSSPPGVRPWCKQALIGFSTCSVGTRS